MHWTAILAKRQFPDHARIIDDLLCIKCGYNLRGAVVGGNCSECGLAVHASLFELAQPERVAAGFRAIARSYLAHYLLLIPLLVPVMGGMDMFVLTGLFLLIANFLRLYGQITLGFRASIHGLPVLGPRLRAMVILGCLEFILLILCGAMWYVFMTNPPRTPGLATEWKQIVGGSWLGVSILGLFATGWASVALASMLEYRICRKELLIQQVLLILSPVIAIVLMTLGLFLIMSSGYQISTSIMLLVGVISLILVWSVAIAYTSTALMRLAGAAEQEQDTMEYLVDLEREAAPIKRAPRVEQPDIKLE